jgi:uncharacterized protein YjbJ (UPF0337 family)
MKKTIFAKQLKKYLLTLSCLLALTFGWQANFIANNNMANAAPLGNNSQLLADLGGSGFYNRAKGTVQKNVGKTQQAIDNAGKKTERAAKKAQRKAEGAAKEMKGNAEAQTGKMQRKM